MDETPIWQDMVGTTTFTKQGSKDVVLKSTGHKKASVSVCLETIHCIQSCETRCFEIERGIQRKVYCCFFRKRMDEHSLDH